VIGLVSEDVRNVMRELASDDDQQPAPPPQFWRDAEPVEDARQGYLHQLDEDGLATWACEHDTAIRMLVRPGDYVFPGAPIAVIKPMRDGAAEAIRNATALSPQHTTSTDLLFAIRQLVEVAVRALSPGINDPHTAISVLDRLGAALCAMKPLTLQTGVSMKNDRVVLVVPHVRYEELVDAMFHMIRQNAAGKPAVLIRMIEVMTQVASCERDPARIASLRRHADLLMRDAEREVGAPSDLNDIRERKRAFDTMIAEGPLGQFRAA